MAALDEYKDAGIFETLPVEMKVEGRIIGFLTERII